MKSHTVIVFLPVLWFFLLDKYTVTGTPICLTWNISGSNLTVECTVPIATYMHDMFIVDPFGNSRTQCSVGDSPGCSGTHKHDILLVDISENTTTLTHKTGKNYGEGEWKCRYGKEETTSYISYTEGSIFTIDIAISGEIRKTKERNEFKLTCFSCWKPYIEGVDFYVNNVLEDSIRYQDGLCYHKRNFCNPEKCTCLSGGKNFTWNFISELSYIQFTCAMRFMDEITSTISIHQADLIYNGSVFIHTQKTNTSISHSDKNLDNTYADEENTNNSGFIGYSVLGTVGLIILVILVICVLQIYNSRKKQVKQKDKKSPDLLIPLKVKKFNEDLLPSNGTETIGRCVITFRNIFNIVLAEKILDEIVIFSNAREHLEQFGFEILKSWGVEVEKDRVSFHMKKLQSLSRRHHIFLHDVTACLFRGRSFGVLRFYDVIEFDLSALKLNKNMYNQLKQIFKMIIDMKLEKWWYHYRQNGLSCKDSSEGAFNLVKQVFLSKKRSEIFQQFNTKESRLSTFYDYPIENKLYRENLALAGFFYYHVSDYVQCFDCGGCLRAWKYTHDPMVRHRDTFSTCHFAFRSEWKRSSSMEAEPVTKQNLYPQKDRLNSFKSFPGRLSKGDLQRLSVAGFYYCGIAEDIVCSECNIGFASVQNSDYIRRLHKQYSRECPNITKCENNALGSSTFNQECISNFVQYLELEFRKHDF